MKFLLPLSVLGFIAAGYLAYWQAEQCLPGKLVKHPGEFGVTCEP